MPDTPEEPGAGAAPDAAPPAKPNVVRLAAVPASKGGAAAPEKGAGRKPAGGKKPEKTVDWGKYNSLIENFTLIYGTDTVWDAGERVIMKLSAMAHAHGNDSVRMWKASSERKTVRQKDVVFDPTETCDKTTCVNLFDGFALEPKAGDVGPFLGLVRHLTSRASDNADEADEIMHWLLCWLAYPLQHKGAKLRNSVVMHGDEGAGKNFMFDVIAQIYGKYGALVGQDELEDKFNDWRSCKLFVVGDEVSSRQELVHNKNRLKSLITSPTVQINPKGLPRREEANHMNIAFLSNEVMPLALDNTDRRYLVIYTPPALDREFYRALGRWQVNGGVAALYEFLLTYPLADYDPFAPAPMTAAKQDLIDMNRKSPELFWLAWSGAELRLPYWPCSNDQAYRAYLKWCQRTGERFPLKLNMFIRMLVRISESEHKPARVKVMAPVDDLGVKRCVKMLLTTDPPDRDQGQWAHECREAFSKELSAYLGTGFTPAPGDFSEGEGA